VDNPVDSPQKQHTSIAVIEALGLGPQYHLGAAVNCIAHAGHAPVALGALQEALWYLERAVDTYSPSPLQMSGSDLDAVMRDWRLSSNVREVMRFLVGGQWVAAHLLLATEIEQLMRSASKLADKAAQ
jgi:hypothetical protein